VLVLFPHADLRGAKTRPAVVVATISEATIERVIGRLAMDGVDVALRCTLALG